MDERPSRKPARDHAVANVDGDLVLTLRRVKVRRIVVAVQNSDRNPQKTTDHGHLEIYFPVGDRICDCERSELLCPLVSSKHRYASGMWPLSELALASNLALCFRDVDSLSHPA